MNNELNNVIYCIFILAALWYFLKFLNKQFLGIALIGISIILLKTDVFNDYSIEFKIIWASVTFLFCVISTYRILKQSK